MLFRSIHLLRGDLDWIVMKALEKDRTRRYETANGFATDVERYLNNEAVLARPPSTLYRFQKLVRRNKGTFAAIGTALATLIVGLALSLYLFFQERAAHQRAVIAEREQSRLRVEVEEKAAVAKQMTDAGLLLSRGNSDEAEKIIATIEPHHTLVLFYSAFGYIHGRYSRFNAPTAPSSRRRSENQCR